LTDELVREQQGNVLVARLNRPEARNALNSALIHAIGAAMLDAEADPEIRVVVLTGTGDRAFCAGMDLREFASGEQALDRDPKGIGGFRRTALEYAERIAANGPLGVAATKELVRLSVTDAARAGERLAELQPVVFGSADAKEGATAFVERRKPVWQGR
jgi:enoyl-CoA hydratase/carnithine racemase